MVEANGDGHATGPVWSGRRRRVGTGVSIRAARLSETQSPVVSLACGSQPGMTAGGRRPSPTGTVAPGCRQARSPTGAWESIEPARWSSPTCLPVAGTSIGPVRRRGTPFGRDSPEHIRSLGDGAAPGGMFRTGSGGAPAFWRQNVKGRDRAPWADCVRTTSGFGRGPSAFGSFAAPRGNVREGRRAERWRRRRERSKPLEGATPEALPVRNRTGRAPGGMKRQETEKA